MKPPLFGILATLVEPGRVRRDDPPPHDPTVPLPTFGHFSIKAASSPYPLIAYGASRPCEADGAVAW